MKTCCHCSSWKSDHQYYVILISCLSAMRWWNWGLPRCSYNLLSLICYIIFVNKIADKSQVHTQHAYMRPLGVGWFLVHFTTVKFSLLFKEKNTCGAICTAIFFSFFFFWFVYVLLLLLCCYWYFSFSHDPVLALGSCDGFGYWWWVWTSIV